MRKFSTVFLSDLSHLAIIQNETQKDNLKREKNKASVNCGKISRNLIQAQLKCLKDGIDKQLLKYFKIAVEGLYTDTKILMNSSTRNVKQIISSHITIKLLVSGNKENNHKNRHRKTDTLHKDHITEGKRVKANCSLVMMQARKWQRKCTERETLEFYIHKISL